MTTVNEMSPFSQRAYYLRSPCRWTGCGAVLDSQAKLMRHAEIVHVRPQPPGQPSYSSCHWRDCREIRSNSGVPNRFLRHVIKHIQPKMTCMIEDCLFTESGHSPVSLERFRRHWKEAHDGGQNLKLKPSMLPDNSPSQPTQPLPDLVPAYQVFLSPVQADPRAIFRSRPPSPKAPSLGVSIMPLSPTKHGRKEAEEKKIDDFSFLDPYYAPVFAIDDLAQNGLELFKLETVPNNEAGVEGLSPTLSWTYDGYQEWNGTPDWE